MGFETPIKIEKVIQGIQSNRYVLPAIQREFVWKPNQIESLFDSIMRGYPIGSFLFWKIDPARVGDYQFYTFMDHYHERDYRHNQPIHLIGSSDSGGADGKTGHSGNEVTAVLDGQQRLTALYIGLNGWYAEKLPYFRWWNDGAFPKRRLYINLLQPPAEGLEYAYQFSMLQDKEAKSVPGKTFWFRVGDVLKFKEVADVHEYCVDQGLTENKMKHPSRTLTRLWERMKNDNLINYFLEEDQDLDKVLNIFIRVNSGGTVLSYSDMLLSIATAQWKSRDARTEIYGLTDRLSSAGNGFNVDKDFVLKSSLVLADINAIAFRVNNFNRENMLKIEQSWDSIDRALTLTMALLKSWGYNWQTLVSSYAAIPLAYYLYKKGNPSNFITAKEYEEDRKKMLHWLRIAILKRTFSGVPDNVLRPIRKAIQGDFTSFPLAAIFNELKSTPKGMDFSISELDGLLDYQYGQNYTFSVLAMLYPWLKYDQQFNLDHIFPRALFTEKQLAKRGIPQDQWPLYLDHYNDLANLQLLQGPVNQSKSDQEFEKWLLGECPQPADLHVYRDLHLIPDVDLSFENFPEFLKARETLLRTKLAEMLNVPLNITSPEV